MKCTMGHFIEILHKGSKNFWEFFLGSCSVEEGMGWKGESGWANQWTNNEVFINRRVKENINNRRILCTLGPWERRVRARCYCTPSQKREVLQTSDTQWEFPAPGLSDSSCTFGLCVQSLIRLRCVAFFACTALWPSVSVHPHIGP